MKIVVKGDTLIVGQTREDFWKKHDVGEFKFAFSVTTFQTLGPFPKDLADRFFDDMKDESENDNEYEDFDGTDPSAI